VVKIVAAAPTVSKTLVMIGSTYDNGDNTDSWCENYQLLPKNIKYQTVELPYGDCARTAPSRLFITDNAFFVNLNAVGAESYILCK